MKKLILSSVAILCFISSKAQDTFSIVAVDSVTREVGSAGASCVPKNGFYPKGAWLISDVFPNRGAINTQAAYIITNQQNARTQFNAGKSPQEVIDYVVANDAGGDATVRQYGAVSLDSTGHPHVASYTGTNCMDYKNHIKGKYYSIQGNILLGQFVLDSIETRFLNTPGTLADRLMAALQGAKKEGSDSRCAPYHTSSLSAFIRVAKPTEAYNQLKLDLFYAYAYSDTNNLKAQIKGDPIDSLQIRYDKYKSTLGVHEMSKNEVSAISMYPNPVNEVLNINLSWIKAAQPLSLTIIDITGREVLNTELEAGVVSPVSVSKINKGFYIVTIKEGAVVRQSGKLEIQ